MGRIDVGGNRAGTQTGYTAYGYSGQNRVLVEGINTTEGTGGAGFYVDYGSFEEVFLGTIGQGAEMPTPGVQSQMLGKSGGNKFQGEIYQDYENNGMISDNISATCRPSSPTARTNPAASASTATRRASTATSNINVGGPIKKDKVWWYFSVSQPEDLRRPAELRRPDRGQAVRHQAVEPVGQDDLSDQPEQQVDRLLPVGPEGPAEPPAARAPFNYTTSDRR